MILPTAETLALAGMGLVGAFWAWKLTITPRLAARKAAASTS